MKLTPSLSLLPIYKEGYKVPRRADNLTRFKMVLEICLQMGLEVMVACSSRRLDHQVPSSPTYSPFFCCFLCVVHLTWCFRLSVLFWGAALCVFPMKRWFPKPPSMVIAIVHWGTGRGLFFVFCGSFAKCIAEGRKCLLYWLLCVYHVYCTLVSAVCASIANLK